MLPPLTNSLSPFHHVAIHFNNNSQSGDSGKSSSVPLPAGSPTGQWQFTRLISRFLFFFFFWRGKGEIWICQHDVTNHVTRPNWNCQMGVACNWRRPLTRVTNRLTSRRHVTRFQLVGSFHWKKNWMKLVKIWNLFSF